MLLARRFAVWEQASLLRADSGPLIHQGISGAATSAATSPTFRGHAVVRSCARMSSMPDRLGVCNTSPLLYPHQVGRLDLLRRYAVTRLRGLQDRGVIWDSNVAM